MLQLSLKGKSLDEIHQLISLALMQTQIVNGAKNPQFWMAADFFGGDFFYNSLHLKTGWEE